MDSLDPKDLLARVATGEASDEEILYVSGLLEKDPTLANDLREELWFSELMRHALHDHSSAQATALADSLETQDLNIEERIQLARDGEMSPAQADELARQLLDEPDQAAALRSGLYQDERISQIVSPAKGEDAFVDSLVTRMWAETSDDRFVKDFTKKLDQIDREEEPANVTAFPGRSWQAKAATVAGLAAAFAVGAFIFTTQLPQSTNKVAVAKILKSTADAIWGEGAQPDSTGSFTEGTYRLEAGAVSLSLSDGKSLAVQGPALFEVDRKGDAILHQGVALATNHNNQPTSNNNGVTNKAGIGLSAPNVRFSDGAATVGLDARSSKSTEAVVFSGETGICLTDVKTCRDVYEFEAVKADHAREKFVDIPYNPRVFSKAWELVSGVEKNMGDVVIELPGTDSSTRQSASNELHVFVENERFQPVEPLEVDVIKPGYFATSEESSKGVELASDGKEMRSYLLQVWPSDSKKGSGEVEASVTFDHQVVGVIFSSERLWESDKTVGASAKHLADAKGRGLDSHSDQILLSEDGRTLNLKLKTGEDFAIDQVRVLVALK